MWIYFILACTGAVWASCVGTARHSVATQLATVLQHKTHNVAAQYGIYIPQTLCVMIYMCVCVFVCVCVCVCVCVHDSSGYSSPQPCKTIHHGHITQYTMGISPPPCVKQMYGCAWEQCLPERVTVLQHNTRDSVATQYTMEISPSECVCDIYMCVIYLCVHEHSACQTSQQCCKRLKRQRDRNSMHLRLSRCV